MKKYVTGFLVLAAAAAMMPAAPARAQVGGPMSDYMLMRVCTASAAPDAAVLQGVAPGDASCAFSRQIAVGEAPPYTLRNFAPNYVIAASTSCPGSVGELLRVNVPVVQSGTVRGVTFSSNAATNAGAACLTAQQVGSTVVLSDSSVQSSDTASGYGYIMGSSSPNGVSLNDAYQALAGSPVTSAQPSTPVCRTATPYSSARFANSWVVGHSPVATTLPGAVEYTTVNLQNITPDQFNNDIATGVTCSTPYVGSFHIWRTDWYMFFSGRQMPAVIAAHYTKAAASNAGPGAAQQFERTYWTREFGLSRWEKWTRSDLLLNGVDPKVVSKALLSHATCAQTGRSAGQPYPIVTNAADSHTSGAMVLSATNGIYQKVIGPDGLTQTWYMTLCADYTNIDRTVTGQPLPTVPSTYGMLWGP